MRRIIITLLAVFFAVALRAEHGFTMYTLGPETILWAVGISPNGRYVSCWLGSGEGSALLDTATGDYYYYNVWSEFDAVTDDGMMIGWGDIGVIGHNPITGETITLDDDAIGKAATTDGKIIVGSVIINGWKQRAFVYKDGELTYLYEPTTEELGFEPGEGSVASYITDDGKTIIGYVINWTGGSKKIRWTLNEESGEYVFDKIYSRSPAALSHSGNYVVYNASSTTDESGKKLYHIGRYNRTTGETQEGETSINCSANGIAEDGTVIAIQSSGMQLRRAVIWTPDMDAPDYMANVYPEVPEFAAYDEDDWNYSTGISSDGRYLCGMAWHYIEGDGEYYARRISWVFDRQEYAETSGIHETPVVKVFDSDAAEYYSPDGKRLAAPQKGLNIIRQNGKVSKVVVK